MNTKLELQSELEKLYTGPSIESHQVYAQLITNFWASLMFSSGLPILYPLAFLFYFAFYWVNKFLLLKFFQKSSRFNEQLSVHSVGYMKYGVLFNLVASTAIFTSGLVPSEDGYDDYTELFNQLGLSKLTKRFVKKHE